MSRVLTAHTKGGGDMSDIHLILKYNDFRDMSVSLVSKGKAIPLQAWTGPEGSRRLRLPNFKTIGT